MDEGVQTAGEQAKRTREQKSSVERVAGGE